MIKDFTNTNCTLPTSQQRALVAMSGGVDSTVAAMLTLRDGADCAGAVMKLHPGDERSVTDARAAADKLQIPFHCFDFSDCFTDIVIESFVNAYSEGRTPNPCIDCNKNIKFGRLMEAALGLGCDCIVTGHYAQVGLNESGRYILKKGADATKDQSYVLYSLSQQQLARIRFPLGSLYKQQVRSLASGMGLSNAQRRESQDICFIPDGDYAGFITEYIGTPQRKGRFVDVEGNDLGENKGIIHYTIGQRRGLGLSMPHPPYVIDIHPEDSTVVIGRDDMLYSKTLQLQGINLIPIDSLDQPLKASVKIRYRHTEQPATVTQIDDDSLLVKFNEPQRAITRGQSAVTYDGEIVIGGGVIV